MSNRQSFNSDDDTSPQFTPTGTRTPVGPDASTAAAAPAVTDFQRRYRAMAATAVDPPIQIVEAGKASDGPGASFVAYTIKVSFAGVHREREQ